MAGTPAASRGGGVSIRSQNCIIKSIQETILCDEISDKKLHVCFDCLIKHIIFKDFWDIKWIEIIMIDE